MRIEGLRKGYRNRPSIDKLPDWMRHRALRYYSRMLAKRAALGKRTLPWQRAILMAVAKRVARQTDEELSRWGLRMWHTLGGRAVQRHYREEGRIGPKHPAVRAYQINRARRRWRKQQQQEERWRQQRGLPPKRRWKRLPLT